MRAHRKAHILPELQRSRVALDDFNPDRLYYLMVHQRPEQQGDGLVPVATSTISGIKNHQCTVQTTAEVEMIQPNEPHDLVPAMISHVHDIAEGERPPEPEGAGEAGGKGTTRH